MNKIVSMVVTNPIDYDNRVKRAASVVSQMGHEVHIICYASEYKAPELRIHGYRRQTWIRPKRLGGLINLLAFYIYAMRLNIAVIRPAICHLHDYDTLVIGRVCSWAIGARLIYDNHEYVQDRRYLHRYPHWYRDLVARNEMNMLKSCRFMVVVSEGIKNLYEKSVNQTNVEIDIVVVRNIPENIYLQEMKTHGTVDKMPESVRAELLEHRKRGRRSILYLGANLTRGRGLSHIIGILKAMPDTCMLYVFGEYSDKARQVILSVAKEASIKDERIKIYSSCQMSDFIPVKACFDWGASFIEPIYDSYYYSLPNKFFEYIMLDIPVISTDIPEQRALIEEYGIGFVLHDESYVRLAARMLDSRPDVRSFARFKREVNWEIESKHYVKMYDKMSKIELAEVD